MKAMLEEIRKGIGSSVTCTWIANEFLKAQGVSEDQFPLYAAPTGETAGFHRCNISRALAKGLKFRPVSSTAKATMDWYQSLSPSLQAAVAPQFATRSNDKPWLETEKHLLENWDKNRKSSGVGG